MKFKVSSWITWSFMLFFFSFLAFHYASMATPSSSRDIASESPTIKPWYDANWKL